MDIKKPRIPSSYSDSINTASFLIAFNPEKVIHYGSSAKKAMYLSSSDIDLIEPIRPSKSDELAKKIKAIVKNISSTRLCYLGDFKSGIDAHYVCDIGTLKGKAVVGFDRKRVEEFIKSRDFEDAAEMLELVKKPITIESYLHLQELMRKKQVLRWSKAKLLAGYKMLRGAKLLLSDTIKDENAMTKIDTIQWIPTESRFVEITNYFKVSKSKDSFDMKDYADSLKKDIIKTYFNGNLFKMCKRILSYSLLMKDKPTATQLFGIVHSGLGIMYKVIADIKAILYLKENFSVLPKKNLDIMIDGFKDRLGSIYEFGFQEEAIDRLIDTSKKDIESLYSLLDRLYNTLTDETRKRLAAMELIPLPSKFYPK